MRTKTDNETRVIILGAAGRDFHDFNVMFRNKPEYYVVAFTATQIPDISGRRYPHSLAGPLYLQGIPIEDESKLTELIIKEGVHRCVLAYSDLPYDYVMRLAAEVNAAGAEFVMLAPQQTMLTSIKPVIAVTAVRTGCGKSQTTRCIASILRKAGKKVAIIRHPMPYGDLSAQAVQRFATIQDMHQHNCTIEEMEEYEHHILNGCVVFAGIDYKEILLQAEKEADIILWDGGNNDTSFFKTDLMITVADPLRPGHEDQYYPGGINFRIADIILINKVNSAKPGNILQIIKSAERLNPQAQILEAQSVITVDKPAIIQHKKVLVIEDGPTLTHGGMQYGAGFVVAQENFGTLVDPRPHAVGSLQQVFKQYPHITAVLPAMGYGGTQIKELEQTINKTPAEAVIIGTPFDLSRLINIKVPYTHVRYGLDHITAHKLEKILSQKGFI